MKRERNHAKLCSFNLATLKITSIHRKQMAVCNFKKMNKITPFIEITVCLRKKMTQTHRTGTDRDRSVTHKYEQKVAARDWYKKDSNSAKVGKNLIENIFNYKIKQNKITRMFCAEFKTSETIS